ncbi:MAG: hypothetical protein OXE78_07405 [Gammaproteobacteria bacterium]|nr:hypothetical protein [Gammaproteobacteria bacterium]
MQSDYPILPITVPLGSGSSSGIVFGLKQLDDWVELGISLVKIGSPFSELINSVVVHMFGNINGKHCIPLNQQGDGMFHIAFFPVPNAEIEENIEVMRETLVPLATSKDYTEL